MFKDSIIVEEKVLEKDLKGAIESIVNDPQVKSNIEEIPNITNLLKQEYDTAVVSIRTKEWNYISFIVCKNESSFTEASVWDILTGQEHVEDIGIYISPNIKELKIANGYGYNYGLDIWYKRLNNTTAKIEYEGKEIASIHREAIKYYSEERLLKLSYKAIINYFLTGEKQNISEEPYDIFKFSESLKPQLRTKTEWDIYGEKYVVVGGQSYSLFNIITPNKEKYCTLEAQYKEEMLYHISPIQGAYLAIKNMYEKSTHGFKNCINKKEYSFYEEL